MLRIYDTRARQVEEIAPVRGVRLYECAPPVRQRAHLGDLRPLLLSDLIRRVLERQRTRMVVCRGLHDLGRPEEEARAYREGLDRDAEALNLRSPEQSPRATEHAGQAVELVSALVEREHAYVEDGHVYFDAGSFPSYGDLSGEPAGSDWVLWQPSDGGWDSPWGRGVPGPHVACSAMSLGRLGAHVAFQTGGTEQILHHEAMRAQSDAVAGHEVVRHWVHAEGLLSESPPDLGEVTDAGLDPLAVRLAFLEHHYRSPLELTWETLRAADATLSRLRARVAEWSESPSAPMATAYVERAEAALDDDLDTPAALRVLDELERDESVPPGAKFESFLHLDYVLALDLPVDIGKPRP